MATYKLTATDVIIRTADNARIPSDSDNFDYQQYQKWIGAGNTPDPAFTAAELTQQAADAAALKKDNDDAVAAKSYAKLVALKGMTPTQVGSWVDSNVLTLADAKDALKTLAIAVSILSRRL